MGLVDKRNYLKEDNFWEATATLLDSSTWKFIMESKTLAQVYGGGHQTSL